MILRYILNMIDLASCASAVRVLFFTALSIAALPAPVAYWTFEDSTGNTLTDKSGSSAHGVVTGSLISVPGISGKAFEFNGSTYVTIPSPPSLPQSFTFSTWVWQSSQNGDVPVLEFCCFTGYSGLHIWLNAVGGTVSPGNIAFNLRPAPMPANAGTNTAAGVLTPGQWHHVVLTFDSLSRTATVYADKVQRSTFTFAGVGNRPTVSGAPLYLGYRPSASLDSRSGVRYTGRMDEIRIYTSSMSQAQVDSVYALSILPPPPNTDSAIAYWNFEDAAGTVLKDGSGNGNNGTIANGGGWGDGVKGKALYFSGSTKISVPGNAYLGAANYSWSAWIKLAAAGDQTLMTVQNASGWPYRRLWIAASQSAGVPRGNLFFDFENVSSSSGAEVFSASALVESGWRHIAVSHNNGTMTFYLDGVLNKTQSFSMGPVVSTDPFFLGAGSIANGVGGFTGWMDEVRIYARALGAPEIAAIHKSSDPSGVRTGRPAVGTLRLRRSGAASFNLEGLGEGVSARVDVLGADGRAVASWRGVRDRTPLVMPGLGQEGTRLLRIRTSEGKSLSLKAVWLTP
jgi:hypothetical protein